MSLQAIETRSVEDSLGHAHDGVSRAANVVELLLSDLTGENNGPEGAFATNSGGIVNSADRLAGRIESLVRGLERARLMVISNSPKGTGATTAMRPHYEG